MTTKTKLKNKTQINSLKNSKFGLRYIGSITIYKQDIIKIKIPSGRKLFNLQFMLTRAALLNV